MAEISGAEPMGVDTPDTHWTGIWVELVRKNTVNTSELSS